MDNEQPKDFVTIDEAISEAYKIAPWHIKILWQMNEHPLWTATFYLALGLIAGISIGSVSNKF